MAASHAFIAGILDKMKSHDTDFRFMAISDFETELQNDSFCMDLEAERKICLALVKLLDDRSVEVQGKTVTCLRLLVKKIHEKSLDQILNKLVTSAATSKEADIRDIAVVGLNGVIDSIHDQHGDLLVNSLIPALCSSLATAEGAIGIYSDCLGLLAHILRRFGDCLSPAAHVEVQKSVIVHLGSQSRRNVRKLAIGCLANLSMYLSDQFFSDIVSYSLQQAHNSTHKEEVRTYIQLIGQISQYSGHRLGLFMDKIIPLISRTVVSEAFEDDTELKENCFQTYESLVERCPREISGFVPQLVDLGLVYLQYDPNYTGCDGDDDLEEEEEDWGYQSGESDDEFDYDVEDDDMSGKVRKACARMLSSIAICQPESLPLLHQKVVPVLIQRFSEREEYVKLDVFHAFIALLRSTSKTCRVSSEKGRAFVQNLRNHVAQIVTSLVRQLSSKQTKNPSKEGIFSVLREMTAFVECIFDEKQVASLIPGVLDAMVEDRHVQLKGIVLQFLRDLLHSHPTSFFNPHFEKICQSICTILHDSHSKQVSADGLRVAERLVGIMRPSVRGAITTSLTSSLPEVSRDNLDLSLNFPAFIDSLYKSVLAKLEDTEVDSEVKECSIECMGIIIATLGDHLEKELSPCLLILLSRLKNEVVRLAAVRSFISIVISPLNINLDLVLGEVVVLLSAFLRKSNRALRQTSLLLLYSIVKSGRANAHPEMYQTIFMELASLISDSDLQLCHLSFLLALISMQAFPDNVVHLRAYIYPRILILLQSQLLQGSALDALLAVFPLLVRPQEDPKGVDEILQALLQQGAKASGKQSATSIAKCVAVTTSQCSPDKQAQIIAHFVNAVKSPSALIGLLLALLCIGEIGRRIDLSTIATELFPVIVGAFEVENASEEIKSAASFALGGAIAGNLNAYLPVTIEEIQEVPRRRYFLLHALKETVCFLGMTENGIHRLQPHLNSIVPILMDNYCHSDKEGMRTVVAECLGRIALVNPEIVSSMHNQLSNADPAVRCTMLLALRHVIVERPQPVDQMLLAHGGNVSLMEGFMGNLRDRDLAVRRAALMSLTHAAHVKPILIIGLLPQILPILYQETKVNPNLMRVVEFGPFRHSVDDGLPIRKAAFECMYTLLDHCIEHLDLREYVAHLSEGLKDVYDIKMLCHLMLIRLTETNYGAAALSGHLMAVIEPLRVTITKTMKETAIKQDIDRNEEQIRSALRAVHSIAMIPHVEKHHRFRDFLMLIKSGPLREKFENVQMEKSEIGSFTSSLNESMEYPGY